MTNSGASYNRPSERQTVEPLIIVYPLYIVSNNNCSYCVDIPASD